MQEVLGVPCEAEANWMKCRDSAVASCVRARVSVRPTCLQMLVPVLKCRRRNNLLIVAVTQTKQKVRLRMQWRNRELIKMENACRGVCVSDWVSEKPTRRKPIRESGRQRWAGPEKRLLQLLFHSCSQLLHCTSFSVSITPPSSSPSNTHVWLGWCNLDKILLSGST